MSDAGRWIHHELGEESTTVVREISAAIRQMLNTRLTEFYHDAAAAPGSARVALTAELVDPVRRVLLARRTFDRSAPAATYDAPGAVPAFNQAITAMLDDVSAWVDATVPR